MRHVPISGCMISPEIGPAIKTAAVPDLDSPRVSK